MLKIVAKIVKAAQKFLMILENITHNYILCTNYNINKPNIITIY